MDLAETPKADGAPPSLIPLASLWVGTVMYSIGPVLVAAATGPGEVLALWRQWIGVGLLGAVWLVTWMRRPQRSAVRGHRGYLWAAASGLFFSVHQLAFIFAVHRSSVVDVTLLQVLLPLIVGALAAIFLRERPKAGFVAWSAVAIAGALVVAIGRGATGGDDWLGMTLAVLNVVLFAGFFLCSRIARAYMDTLPILVLSCLAAAVLTTVGLLALRRPAGDISQHDLLIAIGLAALPGILGHYASTYALPYVPLILPSILQLMIPLIAGLLAWMLLGQPVVAVQVIGGAILLVGVLGVIRSDRAAVPPVVTP